MVVTEYVIILQGKNDSFWLQELMSLVILHYQSTLTAQGCTENLQKLFEFVLISIITVFIVSVLILCF